MTARGAQRAGLPRQVAFTLKYAAFRAGAGLVPLLPMSVAYAIADQLGTAAFFASGDARRAVRNNLSYLFGPTGTPELLTDTTRRVFRNVARYYVDLLSSPAFDVDALRRRRVRAEGMDYLHAALQRGQGVILASAHYGCPEIPLQAARAWGLRFLLLTEPLEPPQLSDLFVRLRAAHGHRTLPVGIAGLKETLRTLRGGGIILLLIDRDIQGSGIDVPYFGRIATMPTGAVELSRATGAALLPVLSHRLAGGGAVVTIQPEVELTNTGRRATDLRANVEAVIQRFEPQIRSDPGQWLVLQRIWSKPRSGRSEARNGDGTIAANPGTLKPVGG